MNWMPVWALPNIVLDESVDGKWTALVPPSDARVQDLLENHPNFRTFMDRFCNSHGDPIEPALIIRKCKSPEQFATSDAIASFRDVVVAATVPRARALQIVNEHSPGLLPYSDFFWIFPWMIARDYEHMIALTPAITAVHDVDALYGHSSPEVSPSPLRRRNLDQPLLQELLGRWEVRYRTSRPSWEDVALFRSLNMANQACLIPGGRDVVMHDYGRLTGLWVVAFETLVHPGEEGQTGKSQVFELLERIPWLDSSCAHRRYVVRERHRRRRNVACWLYERIHVCRNDFFHGNPVNLRSLTLPKSRRLMATHAASLYRLALSAFLDLTWKQPIPNEERLEELVEYSARLSDFKKAQSVHEQTLKLSRVSVEQQRRDRQQRVDAARARSREIAQAIAGHGPPAA